MKTDYKTFKEFVQQNYDISTLEDICKIGCQGGFNGLIYYSETTALYDQYEDELWEMLEEEKKSMGYKHELELIATFNGAQNVSDIKTLKNLIVWFAVEKIAFDLTNN